MELEKNDKIYKLYEKDVSVRNVYNMFFKAESCIIYIVDELDKFTGIITSRKFMHFLGGVVGEYVSRECAVITLKNDISAFKEAEQLFKKYHITTAVPVIDSGGKICYEVRRVRENHDEKCRNDFQNKLNRYAKSKYLSREVIALKDLLCSQPVIVIGTESQFVEICGGMFQSTKNISFVSEVNDAYEFMYRNDKLLIDVSVTDYSGRNDLYLLGNNGYRWQKFYDISFQMIEANCFSRFYRVTSNTVVSLKDYLEKYSDGRLYISSRGILAYALENYLRNNCFEIIKQEGVCRRKSFVYYYSGNGVAIKELSGGEQLILDQADVMLQYYCFNRMFYGQVPVLNFVFDVKVQIPGEGTDIVKDRLFCLSDFAKKGERSSFYEEQDSPSYLKELGESLRFCAKRRFENDILGWEDYSSRLVNIENGIRRTCHQPENYIGTIYVFGMCTIYGALVEDCYTIPSLIQEYVNKMGKRYRVVNLGYEIPLESNKLKEILNLGPNDIIIILFPFITESIKNEISVIEIGEKFNEIWKNEFKQKNVFMDAVQHCGNYGHIIYAQIMCEELKKYLIRTDENDLRKNSIYDVFKTNRRDMDVLYHYDCYIEEIMKEKEKIPEGAEKIGCIVMNCNPFTLGHRYLIEYALKCVDYLFIFVVEEDKSFFSFEDRFKMVKMASQDLENVSVLRSGKMIISSETFPAYFSKEDVKQQESVELTEDLRIFAQYIAPLLNIKYRFIGEEPRDYVTSQYNLAMKRILGNISGIQVIEIQRIKVNSEVISATKVREYYFKKNFIDMSKLVPETTLKFLCEREIY